SLRLLADTTAWTILMSMGIGDLAAQGVLAAASTPVPEPIPASWGPPGDWNKPDNLPGGWYTGSDLHTRIADYYEKKHSIPLLEWVWKNATRVSSIVRDWCRVEVLEPGVLVAAFAICISDIVEYRPRIHACLLAYGSEINPLGTDLNGVDVALSQCQ